MDTEPAANSPLQLEPSPMDDLAAEAEPQSEELAVDTKASADATTATKDLTGQTDVSLMDEVTAHARLQTQETVADGIPALGGNTTADNTVVGVESSAVGEETSTLDIELANADLQPPVAAAYSSTSVDTNSTVVDSPLHVGVDDMDEMGNSRATAQTELDLVDSFVDKIPADAETQSSAAADPCSMPTSSFASTDHSALQADASLVDEEAIGTEPAEPKSQEMVVDAGILVDVSTATKDSSMQAEVSLMEGVGTDAKLEPCATVAHGSFALGENIHADAATLGVETCSANMELADPELQHAAGTSDVSVTSEVAVRVESHPSDTVACSSFASDVARLTADSLPHAEASRMDQKLVNSESQQPETSACSSPSLGNMVTDTDLDPPDPACNKSSMEEHAAVAQTPLEGQVVLSEALAADAAMNAHPEVPSSPLQREGEVVDEAAVINQPQPTEATYHDSHSVDEVADHSDRQPPAADASAELVVGLPTSFSTDRQLLPLQEAVLSSDASMYGVAADAEHPHADANLPADSDSLNQLEPSLVDELSAKGKPEAQEIADDMDTPMDVSTAPKHLSVQTNDSLMDEVATAAELQPEETVAHSSTALERSMLVDDTSLGVMSSTASVELANVELHHPVGTPDCSHHPGNTHAGSNYSGGRWRNLLGAFWRSARRTVGLLSGRRTSTGQRRTSQGGRQSLASSRRKSSGGKPRRSLTGHAKPRTVKAEGARSSPVQARTLKQEASCPATPQQDVSCLAAPQRESEQHDVVERESEQHDVVARKAAMTRIQLEFARLVAAGSSPNRAAASAIRELAKRAKKHDLGNSGAQLAEAGDLSAKQNFDANKIQSPPKIESCGLGSSTDQTLVKSESQLKETAACSSPSMGNIPESSEREPPEPGRATVAEAQLEGQVGISEEVAPSPKTEPALAASDGNIALDADAAEKTDSSQGGPDVVAAAINKLQPTEARSDDNLAMDKLADAGDGQLSESATCSHPSPIALGADSYASVSVDAGLSTTCNANGEQQSLETTLCSSDASMCETAADKEQHHTNEVTQRRKRMVDILEVLKPGLLGKKPYEDPVPGTETVDSERSVCELQSSKPEASEPEASELESSKLEASELESSKLKASEPEASKPEASEPEASKREASQPEAPKPEASELESSKLEASKSESCKPEASELEASKPTASRSEAAELKTSGPEASKLVASTVAEASTDANTKPSSVCGSSLLQAAELDHQAEINEREERRLERQAKLQETIQAAAADVQAQETAARSDVSNNVASSPDRHCPLSDIVFSAHLHDGDGAPKEMLREKPARAEAHAAAPAAGAEAEGAQAEQAAPAAPAEDCSISEVQEHQMLSPARSSIDAVAVQPRAQKTQLFAPKPPKSASGKAKAKSKPQDPAPQEVASGGAASKTGAAKGASKGTASKRKTSKQRTSAESISQESFLEEAASQELVSKQATFKEVVSEEAAFNGAHFGEATSNAGGSKKAAPKDAVSKAAASNEISSARDISSKTASKGQSSQGSFSKETAPDRIAQQYASLEKNRKKEGQRQQAQTKEQDLMPAQREARAKGKPQGRPKREASAEHQAQKETKRREEQEKRKAHIEASRAAAEAQRLKREAEEAERRAAEEKKREAQRLKREAEEAERRAAEEKKREAQRLKRDAEEAERRAVEEKKRKEFEEVGSNRRVKDQQRAQEACHGKGRNSELETMPPQVGRKRKLPSASLQDKGEDQVPAKLPKSRASASSVEATRDLDSTFPAAEPLRLDQECPLRERAAGAARQKVKRKLFGNEDDAPMLAERHSLEEELREVRSRKIAAARAEQYDRAQQLKLREVVLEKKISGLVLQASRGGDACSEVTPDAVVRGNSRRRAPTKAKEPRAVHEFSAVAPEPLPQRTSRRSLSAAPEVPTSSRTINDNTFDFAPFSRPAPQASAGNKALPQVKPAPIPAKAGRSETTNAQRASAAKVTQERRAPAKVSNPASSAAPPLQPGGFGGSLMAMIEASRLRQQARPSFRRTHPEPTERRC